MAMGYSDQYIPKVDRLAVIASRIHYKFDCSSEVVSCPDCEEHYCERHAEELHRLIKKATQQEDAA